MELQRIGIATEIAAVAKLQLFIEDVSGSMIWICPWYGLVKAGFSETRQPTRMTSRLTGSGFSDASLLNATVMNPEPCESPAVSAGRTPTAWNGSSRPSSLVSCTPTRTSSMVTGRDASQVRMRFSPIDEDSQILVTPCGLRDSLNSASMAWNPQG